MKVKLLNEKDAHNAMLTLDNKIKSKERTPKEQLVVDLLCRWCYVIPVWPEPELKRRKLRRVEIHEWEWVADGDDEGREKVYELSQSRYSSEKQTARPRTCDRRTRSRATTIS